MKKIFFLLSLLCIANSNANSLEIEKSIISEIEKEEFVKALNLIKIKNFDVNKKLTDGKYLADYVLFTNFAPTIEMFLRSGMDPNPTGDNYYLNQLCMLGHNDSIKLLINFGAPTEIWKDTNKNRRSGPPCIYFLISRANKETVKFYIEKGIEQYGEIFLNEKLINFARMHKVAADDIYQYVEKVSHQRSRHN